MIRQQRRTTLIAMVSYMRGREWRHTRSYRLARVMTTTRDIKKRENEAIESNALGTYGIRGPIDIRYVSIQEVALPDVKDRVRSDLLTSLHSQ